MSLGGLLSFTSAVQQTESTPLIPSGTVLSGSNLAFYLHADDYSNGDEFWIDRISGKKFTANNLNKLQKEQQDYIIFNGSSSYALTEDSFVTPGGFLNFTNSTTVLVQHYIDPATMEAPAASGSGFVATGSLLHFGTGSNNYSYNAREVYDVSRTVYKTKIAGEPIIESSSFALADCGNLQGCISTQYPGIQITYGNDWDLDYPANVGGFINNATEARTIVAKILPPSGSEDFIVGDNTALGFTDSNQTGAGTRNGRNISLPITPTFMAVGAAYDQRSGSVEANYWRGGIRKIMIYNIDIPSGSGVFPPTGSQVYQLAENIMN